MATIKIGPHAGSRLRAGAALLTIAKTTDTRLVQKQLAAFKRAQLAYAKAQRDVDAAERGLRAGQQHVLESDRVQDEAVHTLARAVLLSGQPRLRPFANLGAPSPSRLVVLAYADEAKAIHRLAAAVRRIHNVKEATQQAADAADKAASAVEQALVPLAALQNAARNARHRREALAPAWEAEWGRLKRAARCAADDGAPQLYAILFDRPRRTAKKRVKHGKSSTAKQGQVAPGPAE